MIGIVLRDLRFAARGLRRTPGFTATAIATLAIGIGASTAVFSVVYGVMFRPLPFPNADRLVQVVQLLGEAGDVPAREGLTPDQVTEWRATSRTLREVGYYVPRSASLTGVGTAVRLNGAAVSVSLFRALGAQAVKGRIFADEDQLPGHDNVVILSHSTWARWFSTADDVIGRAIWLDGRRCIVVGIMGEDFGFPSLASPRMGLNSAGELAEVPEFWMPIVVLSRLVGPAKGGMTLVPTLALLRSGVTVQEATAEVNTLMPARLGERYQIELVSARVEQARAVRPVLLVFQIAVLFVLSIACVNVLNLLHARAAHHHGDLLVRQALGATRWHLATYSVAEGVLLAFGGCIGGCLLTYVVVALLRTLPPFVLPRMAAIRVDAVVLVFACGISIAAGVIVGIADWFRATRRDLAQRAPQWGFRRIGAGKITRPPPFLLVWEIAAGVVLLAGAALLLTSFAKLTSVDRGFEPDGVFTFRVSLPTKYEEAAAALAFHDPFTAALDRIPRVTSVAASSGRFGRTNTAFKVGIKDRQVSTRVAYVVVTPGLFGTLRIPLRGRDFRPSDRRRSPQTVIVNETFARRLLDDRNVVGQTIRFQSSSELQVIGVAGDTRTDALDAAIVPTIYLPQQLDGGGFRTPTYVLRTSGKPALLPAIRAAARRLEPDAVIFEATGLQELLARGTVIAGLYSATAAGFAVVAVLLAAMGLYGLLSYSVATRTREIGIRIALGASTGAVIRGVLRETLQTVLAGVAVGILATLYLSRFIEALLFGIRPRDPATLLAVAVVFISVAGMACYLPTRRATRIDAAAALRTE